MEKSKLKDLTDDLNGTEGLNVTDDKPKSSQASSYSSSSDSQSDSAKPSRSASKSSPSHSFKDDSQTEHDKAAAASEINDVKHLTPGDLSQLNSVDVNYDTSLKSIDRVINLLKKLYKTNAELTDDNFKSLIQGLSETFYTLHSGLLRQNRQAEAINNELEHRVKTLENSHQDVKIAEKWINDGVLSTMQHDFNLINKVVQSHTFQAFIQDRKGHGEDIPKETAIDIPSDMASAASSAHQAVAAKSKAEQSNDSSK